MTSNETPSFYIGTKTLTIDGCGACPFCQLVHCGKELLCGNPKAMVARPYAKDRKVCAMSFPGFCPLEE